MATPRETPDLSTLCETAQAHWYALIEREPFGALKPGAREKILEEERARESTTLAECVDRGSVDAAECQTIAPHMFAFTSCDKLAGPRPEPRATREQCRAVQVKLATMADKPPATGDDMMRFVFSCLLALSSDDVECALGAKDVDDLEVCDEATKGR